MKVKKKKIFPLRIFPQQISFIKDSDEKKYLEWSWTDKKLKESSNYWLTTISPNFTPHLVPVWGIWYNFRFYFSTANKSKKAKNLRNKSSCTLSTEEATSPIIVEGSGGNIFDPKIVEIVLSIYNEKYNWTFKKQNDIIIDNMGNSGEIFYINPKKIFGWYNSPTNMVKWIISDNESSTD